MNRYTPQVVGGSFLKATGAQAENNQLSHKLGIEGGLGAAPLVLARSEQRRFARSLWVVRPRVTGSKLLRASFPYGQTTHEFWQAFKRSESRF